MFLCIPELTAADEPQLRISEKLLNVPERKINLFYFSFMEKKAKQQKTLHLNLI